jgi:hypothetical protein
MRGPYSIRYPARWIGLGLCLATLGVYLGTILWSANWYSGSGFLVLLARGTFQVSLWDPAQIIIHYAPGFDLVPRIGALQWTFATPLAPLVSTVIIPLWLPLAVFTVFTAAVWRRARRIPPGHCQVCGYNLTGNVSGICPECGTPI